VPGVLDEATRFAVVESLGKHLMSAIGRAVPAPPVPLVASLFDARPGKTLGEKDLLTALGELISRLRDAGVRLQLPGEDESSTLRAGLRALIQRGLIEEKDGRFLAVPAERNLLVYYANSIAHLV